MRYNELVSMIVFGLSVIISAVMWIIKKRRKNNVFTGVTPLKVFTIGFVVSLSAYIFLSSVSNNLISLIDSGFVTFRNVKKYFKLDLAPSEFNQVISQYAVVTPFGRYYLTLLDLIIPAITFKLLYTAFRDYLTQWVYFFRRWRKFHIFSELNEKTICLAEDIFDHEKKCTFIFANVSDKYADGLLERAKRLNAHFTPKTIADFSYYKRQNTIYIMSDDDSKNMGSAIEINALLNRKQVDGEVFVLSSFDTSPELIDAINLAQENKHCSAHLINSAQIVSNNLLFDYPLFKAAERTHSKKISVMVIGAGYIGMEFAKNSMYTGLMETYDYEITIVDNADKESEILSAVGDLNEKLRDVRVHVDYRFEVADVHSDRFKELIREHADANYIVVSLGNDELTVNTSVTIRRELIRAGVGNGTYCGKNDAFIIPIISDKNYASLLQYLDADYNFLVYGSFQQVFRRRNIGYSPLDKVAAYIDWEYSKNYDANASLEDSEKQYKRASEINKKSSRAAAVKTLYHLKDAGVDCSFDGKVRGNELSLAQADALLRAADLQELEHKRWSVFMTINGWDVWKLRSDDDYVSIEKFNRNKHKMPIAKLHGCLIANERLDDISAVVPSAGEKDAFRKNDIIIVNASAKALGYAFDAVRFSKDVQEG